MKKTMFALALVSFASSAFAADFSKLVTLRAADIRVKTEGVTMPVPVVPVTPVTPVTPVIQVPQDLVYKFNQVKNDIWRLESDTAWLRSDIDRLESAARRITQANSS
ncbi:MAG: hypothetical protein Q8O90_06485, partial [Elusimicrobiota bacterium]|nr:hypothetical protein [Elusimicrobiota bacterium]